MVLQTLLRCLGQDVREQGFFEFARDFPMSVGVQKDSLTDVSARRARHGTPVRTPKSWNANEVFRQVVLRFPSADRETSDVLFNSC